MNNFDLTKYLAESKLLKEELTWYIEDENEDIRFQNDEYLREVEKKIKELHPEISDEDLNKIIIMTGEQYSREEDFHGDSITSGNFVKAAVEIYQTDILAEGNLHEAMSPQDVVDIADTVAEEFTKESADEGDFMVYSVGRMDADDMSFELDTDVTSQTPERILKMSNLGVGEGWGGNFRIKPKSEGYEVRNVEKGGLVAIIDAMGNFKMISADESKAEMGRAKGEETDYMERRRETSDYMEEGEALKSNKMKKSELKEMIKAAMLAETSVEETLVDADQDMAEAILNALGGEAAFEAVVRAMSTDDAQTYLGGIMRDYDIEMGPVDDIPGFEGTMDALDSLSIREEEEEDVEDIEIDTEEEVDVDIDMDSDVEGIDVKQDADAELSGTVGDVQDNLEAALEAARKLGDEKLEDQIGNTLTFFTRAHVVKEDMLEDEAEMGLEEVARMKKLAGLK